MHRSLELVNMIILYDIAFQIDATVHPSVSPSTLKARIALNYKRIPFFTEYIEFCEIQNFVKSIGARPLSARTNLDGSPRYTLPTIRDTATGAVVSDSTEIAEYLDKMYPETPSGPLFPHGSRAAIALFEQTFMSAFMILYPILSPHSNKMYNPVSQEYHRRVNEAFMRRKFEEIPDPGSPEHEADMKQTQEAFDRLAKLYERNGRDSLWFLGDTFSFADIIALSFIAAIKITVGEDNDVWKMASWNDGKWAKLVDATASLRTDVAMERSATVSKKRS